MTMEHDPERQLCAWQVTRADGTLLGEGAFFESDYLVAVSRAKEEAAPYTEPGATLTLAVGRMSILTMRL
jgi:hypothetical protein